jgi:hypothetical protein
MKELKVPMVLTRARRCLLKSGDSCKIPIFALYSIYRVSVIYEFALICFIAHKSILLCYILLGVGFLALGFMTVLMLHCGYFAVRFISEHLQKDDHLQLGR